MWLIRRTGRTDELNFPLNTENGGSMFLQNISINICYEVSNPGTLHSEKSPLCNT
jgi:hypothetical protein